MPLHRRHTTLLCAATLLLAAGCASTQPRTGTEIRLGTPPPVADVSPCADPAPSSSIEPLSAADVEQRSGALPEPIGGLEAVLQRLVLPEGYCTRGERVRVMVEFVVDAAGCPRQLRLLDQPDAALGAAALAAVRQSRFIPGEVEGAPVPVRVVLPFSARVTC